MTRNVGLVLSGGGARGLFAATILMLMRKVNYDFDKISVISGVSVGTIIGAMETQGEGEKVMDVFMKMKNKDVYGGKMNFWQTIWSRIKGKNYILDIEPLHTLLSKYVSLEKAKKSPILFKMGVTDLQTGEYRTFTQFDFDKQEDYIRCIMASCSQPVIWKPQSFRTKTETVKQASDGGIVEVSPIGAAIGEGVESLIIINSSPLDIATAGEFITMESILFRTIDLTIGKSFKKDMQKFYKANQDAVNGITDKRFLPAILYQTSLHEDSLDFESDLLKQQRINDAYQAYINTAR